MPGFDLVAEKTLRFEGGYSNDEDDPGGETNRGITIRTARRGGYEGEMKDLTEEQAKDIYKRLYWNPLHLDKLGDPGLTLVMFDTAVNMGLSWPILYLQGAINIRNIRVPAGLPQILEDGIMGPQTEGSANALLDPMEARRAIREFILNERLQRYRFLIQRNKKLAKFSQGWINRVNTLRSMLDSPEMQIAMKGEDYNENEPDKA